MISFPTDCNPYQIVRSDYTVFYGFFKSDDWEKIQDKTEWRRHMIYAECQEKSSFRPELFKIHLALADGNVENVLLNLESLRGTQNVEIAIKLVCFLLIYHPETVEREHERLSRAIQEIGGNNWLSEAMIILLHVDHRRERGSSFRHSAATLAFLEKSGVMTLPSQEELSKLLQELAMFYESRGYMTPIEGVLDCCKFLRKYGADLTSIYEKFQSKFSKKLEEKNWSQFLVGHLLANEWISGVKPLNEEQSQLMEKHLACLQPLSAFPEIREQIRTALYCDLELSSENYQNWEKTNDTTLYNLLQQLSWHPEEHYVELAQSFLGDVPYPDSTRVAGYLTKLCFILLKIDPELCVKVYELMKTSESDKEREEILRTFYSFVGVEPEEKKNEEDLFKLLTYGLRIYDRLKIIPLTWNKLMQKLACELAIEQFAGFVSCLSTLQKKDVADKLSIFWTYTEQTASYLPLKFCVQLINALSDKEVNQIWHVFLKQPKRFAALIGTKLEVLLLQYGPMGRTMHNCALITDACINRAKTYDWTPTPFYQEVEEARKRPLLEEECEKEPVEIKKFHHVSNRTIVGNCVSEKFNRFVKMRRVDEEQKEFESEYKVTRVYRRYQMHQKSQMPIPIRCGKLQPLPLSIHDVIPVKVTDDVYVYKAPKAYGDYISEGGSIEGLFNACHDIGWSISQGVFPEGIFDHNGQNKRRYLPLIDLFRSWGWPHNIFGALTLNNTLGPGRVDRPQKAARHENYRGSGRADYGDLLLANQVVNDLKLLSSGDVGRDEHKHILKYDYLRPLIEANALVQPVLEVACILTERLRLAGRLKWDLVLDDWDTEAIKEHCQQLQRAMAEIMVGYTGQSLEDCLNFLVECGVNWNHLSKAMFLAWDHQRFAEQLKSGKWPFPELFPEKAKIEMGYEEAENWDADNGFGRFEEAKFSFDIGPFNGPRALPPVLYLENIMASICLSLRRGPVTV